MSYNKDKSFSDSDDLDAVSMTHSLFTPNDVISSTTILTIR